VDALTGAPDPLRLNLPPLLNREDGVTPTETALRALAACYLQAELEETGIIPVAEALARIRDTLSLTSALAAQKLEAFAQHGREWYAQDERRDLFARLFGLGPEATLGADDVNRDFQQRLASFCLALARYGQTLRRNGQPGPMREAALRQTATHLLLNLGRHRRGSTVYAARRIQAQLQQATDLLQDPQIGALFQARGMWDLLRRVLGDGTPDLGRHLTRGQSGQRLLHWLASILPKLQAPNGSSPLPPRSSVYVWAAAWLQASGIDPRSDRGLS
jgi:hypothetical protein